MDEPMLVEWERDGYALSSDPRRLDLVAVHRYLTASYWSPGLPADVLTRAVAGSVCFGVYRGAEQVGFARVVTDGATFAYLCDVYVLDAHRRQGLGRWLMEAVVAHPTLQGLRRVVLVTRDAHGLYERFGFRPLARPEGYMEWHRPDVYTRPIVPDTESSVAAAGLVYVQHRRSEGNGLSDRGSEFGFGMRWLLMGCGPMNVIGAACFAPPVTAGRQALGLPEPHPFYLWVLSAWILAFGAAYFRQGWSGRANREVLALGAWGKCVFSALLIGLSMAGELPPLAVVGAVPDLALAVVFAVWLWRRKGTAAEPSVAPDGGEVP